MNNNFSCVLVAVALLGATSASAEPIAGLTYTYDLSEPDPMDYFTIPHPGVPANDTDDATDPSAVTSLGKLADGDLGSEVFTDPSAGCCLFNNGTFAGFRNDGAGGTPQPKIDVDLGGLYNLNSFTLHYLVEDRPAIYAPQPIGEEVIQFDALTVSGSSDGTNFTPLGFTNDFIPVFGLEGDFGTDVAEVRTATIDLSGTTATHLSIDVRTLWSFIFMSEIVVDGALATDPGDFDSDGDVDGADFLVWQRDTNVGNLSAWEANFGAGGNLPAVSAVPEPASFFMFGLGSLLLAVRKYS